MYTLKYDILRTYLFIYIYIYYTYLLYIKIFILKLCIKWIYIMPLFLILDISRSYFFINFSTEIYFLDHWYLISLAALTSTMYRY